MDAGLSSQSIPSIATFESSARAIVGPEHIRPAGDISGGANATNSSSGTDFSPYPWLRASGENPDQPKLHVEPANEQ